MHGRIGWAEYSSTSVCVHEHAHMPVRALTPPIAEDQFLFLFCRISCTLGLVGAKEQRTRVARMSGVGMVLYLSRLDTEKAEYGADWVREPFAPHNCGCFCDVKNCDVKNFCDIKNSCCC